MPASYSLRVVVDMNAIDTIPASTEVQSDMDRRASNVVQHQRRLVPVDTGLLKSSLDVRKNANGLGRLIGSFAVPYAAAVELGHQRGNRFVPGQPYLRPSVDSAKD